MSWAFPRKTFPDDFQDGIEKDTTQEVIDTSLKTKLKEGHDEPEGVEKIAEPSRVGVALSPTEVQNLDLLMEKLSEMISESESGEEVETARASGASFNTTFKKGQPKQYNVEETVGLSTLQFAEPELDSETHGSNGTSPKSESNDEQGQRHETGASRLHVIEEVDESPPDKATLRQRNRPRRIYPLRFQSPKSLSKISKLAFATQDHISSRECRLRELTWRSEERRR
jgi:hypothetical protein